MRSQRRDPPLTIPMHAHAKVVARLSAALALAARIGGFAHRVLKAFLGNRGLLLAGGVGYNALLSIVPLLSVVAWGLAHLFDEALLITAFRAQARAIAPGQASLVIDAVNNFLATPNVLGATGFLVLVFFGSIAFRMLAEALALVFHRNRPAFGRSRWLSALLPYIYVLVFAAAALVLTIVFGWTDRLSERSITLYGWRLELWWLSTTSMYLSGLVALGLLFTSIYKVLSGARIALHRALVAGFTVAALWTFLTHALVYYFANISYIDLIYGSLATPIVVLLTLELCFVIVLLGGQAIAELERSAVAGLHWHESADWSPQR